MVKLIPKKDLNKNDPNNYRPISLTSSIARLSERFILQLINEHLYTNNIIVKDQSGFRSSRQTKDNILNICQKNIEAFNQNKKNCIIFFDICKAFDKVWHRGLLYKLKKLKFSSKIILWVKEFLQDRTFKVRVNDSFSNLFNIEAGVPQGGVLSPILFSIYINDIIFKSNNNIRILSSLFADDLATSCASKKLVSIEKVLNVYLKKIEKWLNCWRLKMAPSKCNYMIFTKNKKHKKLNLKLQFFNQLIPKSDSTKFLGVSLDSNMNLNKYAEELYIKCKKRINILKILAHPKYNLTNQTLKIIYFALIRSILDYSSTIFSIFSPTNQKKLNSI